MTPITAEPILRQHRLFESTDLDDTRDRIADVLAPHRLVPLAPRPRIQSQMGFLHHGGLGLGVLRYGSPMGVRVPQMTDCHLVILLLSGHGLIRVGDEVITLDTRQGFACNPGERFDAEFSADCAQLFIRLDQAALRRHAADRGLILGRRVDLSHPTLQPWLGLVRLVTGDPATLSLIGSDPHVAGEYERLFVSLLLAGQPHGAAPVRPAGIAPAAIRRAEAFITEHSSEALTLQDIATASGISARALLGGFARFRTTSPMRYLRDVRLDRARSALGAREDAVIADVAAACGFPHPGRFSQAYCHRFGELPSVTVGRRRSFGASGPRRAAADLLSDPAQHCFGRHPAGSSRLPK